MHPSRQKNRAGRLWRRARRPILLRRGRTDRKSTRLNSSHTVIYTLSLHDALPIWISMSSSKNAPFAPKKPGWSFMAARATTNFITAGKNRSEEHTSELQSHRDLHSFPTRRSSDLDFNEQLEKCTLRAKKTGLVVYGGARDDQFYYGGEERIREGASVRERQAIITIPDLTRMSVNVKIHESYIKKVKKGQKARMTVDAFPDDILTGEVTKVGVLPDS